MIDSINITIEINHNRRLRGRIDNITINFEKIMVLKNDISHGWNIVLGEAEDLIKKSKTFNYRRYVYR